MDTWENQRSSEFQCHGVFTHLLQCTDSEGISAINIDAQKKCYFAAVVAATAEVYVLCTVMIFSHCRVVDAEVYFISRLTYYCNLF